MKPLQNLRSYVLGLIPLFRPQLTDTLNEQIQELIRRLQQNNLKSAAENIIYLQEQQMWMDEMELLIKWLGVLLSAIAVVFIYLKDMQAIHEGLYYFIVTTRNYLQKAKHWLQHTYKAARTKVCFWLMQLRQKWTSLF